MIRGASAVPTEPLMKRVPAEAARTGPPTAHPPRAYDLLLDGMALLTTVGFTAGTPMLKRALSGFRATKSSRMSCSAGPARSWSC